MIEAVSEDTILITLAEAIEESLPARIAGLADNIRSAGSPWLVDIVPSYTTLMVVYDPLKIDFRQAVSELRPLVTFEGTLQPAPDLENRLVELPVYYSTETGLTCNGWPQSAAWSARTSSANTAPLSTGSMPLGLLPDLPLWGKWTPPSPRPERPVPENGCPLAVLA